MSNPLTLAAIDAGSNAIRVMVARPRADGRLEEVVSERVPVRLGRGTFVKGALERRCIESAVVAFSRFRKLFDQHGVTQYRAVATSAVRSASNREDLLSRLFRELNIELEVIDGEEEGRLIRKAVLHAMVGRKQPTMIADLGGGSLEVMLRQGNRWTTHSMKLGTVRLIETFGLKGRISEDELRMIRRFMRMTFRSTFPEPSELSPISMAVASGGNPECLAGLFGDGNKSGPATLELAKLEAILPQLSKADLRERMDGYGVRKDRADVMAVAAIVLEALGKELNFDRYYVPKVGIREGILLDLLESAEGELREGDEIPAVASARTFADRIGHNTAHGEQVKQIADRLFDELKGLHNLRESNRVILQLAALLHDIGEVVHRQSHHKHTEYLIAQGRIPGLEGAQRTMVAAVARAHRKSLPDERKHPSYAALSPTQQRQARKLAVLLRVADALDMDHRQRVVAVSADVGARKVILKVSTEEGVQEKTDLLERRTADFETVFGRKLEIEFRQVAGQRSRRGASGERAATVG